MSLWTNTDNDAGKPKNLSTADKAVTFGVSVTEAQQAENIAKGISTPGWTKHTQYTNAQGVIRNKSEVLVAFGGDITSDSTDDTVVVDRTVTITTAPVGRGVTAPESTSFTVVASVTPTAPATYKWQTNGGSGTAYTDIADDAVYSGATSETLTISDSTGLNGYKYRVVVGAEGATSKTSSGVTLTVA